jgi:hypothetical protein
LAVSSGESAQHSAELCLGLQLLGMNFVQQPVDPGGIDDPGTEVLG